MIKTHHPARLRMTTLLAWLLLPAAAFATGGPNFDSVAWQPLGCDSLDLIKGDTNPPSASFAGDQINLPAFYGHDADYLYFRYRMDDDPRKDDGFDQFVWTALMQVPSGNRFQYQYQLSLNGKDDTIVIRRNTQAINIDFSSTFIDPSEEELYKESYKTGSLVRAVQADTLFNGQDDWFIDFAFPVSTLTDLHVISSDSDLAQSFFFPATSTNDSNYNKSYLNCPFQPYTTLTVQKTVAPAVVPANTETPVTYTIDVYNTTGPAVGVVIKDVALPAFLGNVRVDVTKDDPGATFTVESTNPLRVTSPTLATGAHVTVKITADAAPGCGVADFINTAKTYATNALEHTASAPALHVQNTNGEEECDGKDNDCDGQVDEGTAALCNDGNACNGVETCGGAAGCQGGTAPTCDDGSACNGVETCDSAVGCQPGTPVVCTAADQCHAAGTCDSATGLCSNPAKPDGTTCSDGDACTQSDTCASGACTGTNPVVCTAADQCHTAGTCDSATGLCSNPAKPDGTTCSDGDACTESDTCAGGTCTGTATVCNDGDACNGVETCNAETGCQAGTAPACDDANACNGVETCNPATGCDPGTPLTCGQGNTCTVETGCLPCATATQCDDSNPCTADTCDSSVCGSFIVAGCKQCETAADCDDANPCTTDACGADHSCQLTTIGGCQPCSTAADCNDDNACTDEVCDGGKCGHQDRPSCTPCKTDGNCDDSNPCTSDVCGTSGSCELTTRGGCEPCATVADCASDNNACTVETCSEGICIRPATPGCVACTTAADCPEDGDNCTTKNCTAGVCGSQPAANCCTTAAGCNDSNPCTTDVCSASGSCELTTVAGCRPCTTANDCDDANRCTTDVCTGGTCAAQPIDGCGVEQCTDATDNDGDGAIDCADDDCSGDAACATEICGDCQDNDNDGLVDYEDPDCCDRTDPLTLRRMTMRMPSKAGRNRLRLRGNYLTTTAGLDPTRDGVTLQIADGNGQIYCHDIPLRSTKRSLKRGVFRFRDRTGTLADGLRNARVKIRKDGRVVFRAKGRKMQFRAPTGNEVAVTLRVGNQCTQTTAAFRTRHNKSGARLMFP